MAAKSESQIGIIKEVQDALFVDDSDGGKRNAAVDSTPDREGQKHSEKSSRVAAVYPTVPVMPAPSAAAPLQSAAHSGSSSGGEVSMANIEMMFSRLLQNTKAEI